MRFPEQMSSVACLCNLASTNPTVLARRLADLYLAELMEPAEGAITKAWPRGAAAEPAGWIQRRVRCTRR